MKKISLLFVICFILNACSFFHGKKEEAAVSPTDSLEFGVDATTPSQAEIKVEEEQIIKAQTPDEIAPAQAMDLAKTEEVKKEETKEQIVLAPEEPKMDILPVATSPEVATTEVPSLSSNDSTQGQKGIYKVQKGDTLMMVAFKIYGDYHKWKDLRNWNKDKSKLIMSPGVSLKYVMPEKTFEWKPTGLPYVTKTGDTLRVISKDKYGTPKKWKDIFENNRPLIQDPNLIFAGFTIYYIPSRDIASEKK